jgi:nucleotide-binding universal stress UspA family protein
MKILLAVDESEYSKTAIKEVIKRPWPKGTSVRVLTVIQPFPAVALEPWYGGRDSLGIMDRELHKRAQSLTSRTVAALKKEGIKAESAIRQGDPRSEIVEEAETWSADLILIGSHGYTALKRFFLGSVASSVVTHAACSVEIVRRKQGKKKTSR